MIDIDTPDADDGSHRWSATELSEHLTELTGTPVHVWGQVSKNGVDAAYRKLRQFVRETENDDTKANRVHSAHKALSFLVDVFPVSWWKAHRIGAARST